MSNIFIRVDPFEKKVEEITSSEEVICEMEKMKTYHIHNSRAVVYYSELVCGDDSPDGSSVSPEDSPDGEWRYLLPPDSAVSDLAFRGIGYIAGNLFRFPDQPTELGELHVFLYEITPNIVFD